MEPHQPMRGLQGILNSIEAAIEQSGAQLHPILMGFLALFGMLAFFFVLYAIAFDGHRLQSAVGLVIRLLLVAFMVDSFPWAMEGVQDIALKLGSLATGNRVQAVEFLDPGSLVRKGIVSAGPMWTAFKNNLGWTSFVTGFAYLAAWVAYCAAFTVMAWKVFWWQAEALIVGLAGLGLIPTLMFRPTAFIAGGCVSYIPNMAAKFLIGSILTGLLWTSLDNLVGMAVARPLTLANVDIQIQEAFVAVGYSWVVAASFLAVNTLAGVVTGGIPGMAGGRTFGGFLRTMAGIATGIMTGGAMAGAGAVGATRVGLGALQGGLGGINAAGRLMTGNAGVSSMGEATRHLYAGVRSGMNTAESQRLGQLMHGMGNVGVRQGQRTLEQLMMGHRQVAHRDTTMNGARR